MLSGWRYPEGPRQSESRSRDSRRAARTAGHSGSNLSLEFSSDERASVPWGHRDVSAARRLCSGWVVRIGTGMTLSSLPGAEARAFPGSVDGECFKTFRIPRD